MSDLCYLQKPRIYKVKTHPIPIEDHTRLLDRCVMIVCNVKIRNSKGVPKWKPFKNSPCPRQWRQNFQTGKREINIKLKSLRALRLQFTQFTRLWKITQTHSIVFLHQTRTFNWQKWHCFTYLQLLGIFPGRYEMFLMEIFNNHVKVITYQMDPHKHTRTRHCTFYWSTHWHWHQIEYTLLNSKRWLRIL